MLNNPDMLKQKLPTVSHDNNLQNLISGDTIEKLTELTALSPESASYALEGLETLRDNISKKRIPDDTKKPLVSAYDDMIDIFKVFVERVQFQVERPGVHDGAVVKSDIETLNEKLGEQACDALRAEGKPIEMDWAVLNAQFVRGFSFDNPALDVAFSAWLVENGYAIKEGKVFEVKNGVITNIAASDSKFIDLMTNTQSNFADYLDKKGLPNVVIRQQEFPGAAQAPVTEASAEKAPVVPTKNAEEPQTTLVNEPENPSTIPGTGGV